MDQEKPGLMAIGSSRQQSVPRVPTQRGRTVKATLSTLAAFIALATGTWAGERVIHFRNNGTGAYPDADPPLEWSVTKNVKWHWHTPVLGKTISGPLVVGERIVTLASPMIIVCLDKNTGKELWRREKHLEAAQGGKDKAFEIHEAIRRDHRIKELASILGVKEKGATSLARTLDPRKGLGARLKAKGMSAEDKAFVQKQIKLVEAAIADGKANKAKYEAELADLKTKVPTEKHAIRAGSYLCATTPESDGERIFAIFSPGLLVCHDLEGRLLWTHALVNDRGGLPKRSWGTYTKVPALADGKLVAAWGDIIHCLDAKTGNVIWKGQDSGAHCAACPVIGTIGGKHYVALGGRQVRSLDDGKLVFTAEVDGALRAPLYGQRSVSADRRTFYYGGFAMRLQEDPAKPVKLLWQLGPENWMAKKGKDTPPNLGEKPVFGGSHQYCPPVAHEGIVYYQNTHNKRFFSALDAETGNMIYGPHENLTGATYSDLTLAGNYLFLFDSGKGGGRCIILKKGRTFEKVGENQLEPLTWNNPVFEGKRMYVRTHRSLFCMEKPQ